MHSKSRPPPPPVPFSSLPPLHTLYSSFTFPFTPSLLFALYEEGRARHRNSMKWDDWFSLWSHTACPDLNRMTPPSDLTALPHHFIKLPPSPTDPPYSAEHCDWLYGIFGHETSCTRYWTCWNGTATEQFCIGGLLYNEETHACDWPQNVGGCQKHREFTVTLCLTINKVHYYSSQICPAPTPTCSLRNTVCLCICGHKRKSEMSMLTL